MKKGKLLSCLLAISLIAASLGACGKEDTGEVSVLQNRKETFAKVISLDGDQITVVLADIPEKDGTPSDEGGRRGGTPPEGGATPPEGGGAPPSGSQPPTSGAAVNGGQSDSGASSGQSAPSDLPDRSPLSVQQDQGSDQKGDRIRPESGLGGGKITFNEEEVTFSLSSDLKITKGNGKGNGKEETEIDLSEIAEGSVIMFTTATDENGNEVIDTIRVLE